MAPKREKWDAWGRRTDRVKKREVDEMHRLSLQGLTHAEIANKLRRKPETVKHHLDARNWGTHKPYEAAPHKQKMRELVSIDEQGGRLESDKYAQHRREHWVRLGKLAEELRLGLAFSPSIIHESDSRFGGIVRGSWLLVDDSRLRFSAELQGLFRYLVEHLNHEFPDPSFRDQFREFREIVSEILKRQPNGDFKEISGHQLANSIRRKLWLVIERGTFKGTCDICKDWY